MESIEQVVTADIAAINTTFRDLRVRARVAARGGVRVCGGSFITYTLEITPGVSVKDVHARADDIRYAVRQARQAQGMKRTAVRVCEDMTIEVDHPMPSALDYNRAVLRLAPGAMLAGRDYSECPAVDSVVDLESTAHVLVAGNTGSGKSTLVRSLVGTLALNTSPEDLALYLVDLKNEDLLEFEHLPHVRMMAVDPVSARRAVQDVWAIAERRRKEGGKVTGTRHVLIIDELAQLGDYDVLGSVLSIGRSKRVHVVAATQKPTVKLIGDKANYTQRLVGRVADATEASIATGRAKTGAEMLPGRGAFLRIGDGEINRIQVYNFGDSATAAIVEAARRKWADVRATTVRSPVITGDEAPFAVENWPKTPQNTGSPVITGDRSPVFVPAAVPQRQQQAQVARAEVPVFPINGGREFTAAEAAAVREMYEGGASLTAICKTVYGGAKNKERMDRIKVAAGAYALDGGAE